jgi:hypothetical protein
MDLFYRLLRSGASIRYEPDALVYHERQTESERRVRRPMYGRGMGACCGIWLRQGDLHAVRILGAWLLLRLARIVKPAGVTRRMALREELLILHGTLQGLVYGLRVGHGADTCRLPYDNRSIR